MSVSTPVSRTVDLGDGLTVTVDEQGDATAGSTVLVLHGGAGPASVAGLAAALAEHAHVITPTHPGFDGRPRPDWTDSVADLAIAYLGLLADLELRHVLVLGSSIGGWIAAEMALHDIGGRVAGLVLLNAVGIEPDTPADLTDTRTISPVELAELAFHDPALRPDPAALDDEQRAILAANQRALAVYAGEPFMYDPKLRRRLRQVTVPVLVVWGERDGVATVAYGRAFAAAFARSEFDPIPDAGHFPHIEQADRTRAAIDRFVSQELARSIA